MAQGLAEVLAMALQAGLAGHVGEAAEAEHLDLHRRVPHHALDLRERQHARQHRAPHAEALLDRVAEQLNQAFAQKKASIDAWQIEAAPAVEILQDLGWVNGQDIVGLVLEYAEPVPPAVPDPAT